MQQAGSTRGDMTSTCVPPYSSTRPRQWQALGCVDAADAPQEHLQDRPRAAIDAYSTVAQDLYFGLSRHGADARSLHSSTALLWHLAVVANDFDVELAHQFDTTILVEPTTTRGQRFRIVSIQRVIPPTDARSKTLECSSAHRMHIVGFAPGRHGASTHVPLGLMVPPYVRPASGVDIDFLVDCLDAGLCQLAHTAVALDSWSPSCVDMYRGQEY